MTYNADEHQRIKADLDEWLAENRPIYPAAGVDPHPPCPLGCGRLWHGRPEPAEPGRYLGSPGFVACEGTDYE